MDLENKVINVKFFGGLMSLFNSPRGRLEKAIQKENQSGWTVRQVISANVNPVYFLFSIIILVVTLFIYQPLPGYMVIMKKEEK